LLSFSGLPGSLELVVGRFQRQDPFKHAQAGLGAKQGGSGCAVIVADGVAEDPDAPGEVFGPDALELFS
jgi:hypothetical protein